MIGQLHFAGVARQSGGFGGRDIQKHLIGIGGDHVHRAVADLHRRSIVMRLPRERGSIRRRQARRALRHDRFEPLHGVFIRSSADVARAVVVIVGEDAADFAVVFDARRPVALIAGLLVDPARTVASASLLVLQATNSSMSFASSVCQLFCCCLLASCRSGCSFYCDIFELRRSAASGGSGLLRSVSIPPP